MAFDFPNNPIVGGAYQPPGTRLIYVWTGYAWISSSASSVVPGPIPYVRISGDTMTGPLTLPGNPTAPLDATPKQYVDALGVPLGGAPGEALVKSALNIPTWAAPIDGANF
jgi:hypothetical protein